MNLLSKIMKKPLKLKELWMTKALIKGKKYTFYFKNKYGELIQNNLTDIFNKCSLEQIVLYEEK